MSSTSTNGKGDTPRPRLVSYEEYARNWERAFGRKDAKTAETKETKTDQPRNPQEAH